MRASGASTIFFFFSSRRRHTRYWRDWSSDVCSSDLVLATGRLATGYAAAQGSPFVPISDPATALKIGRASCRERVEISVVDVSLKKKGPSASCDRKEREQQQQNSRRRLHTRLSTPLK